MVKKLLQIVFTFFVGFCVNNVVAQIQNTPPMRQVIATSGGSGTISNWGTIDYTVGEAIIITESVDSSSYPFSSLRYLTQGFQQPESNDLIVVEAIVNVSCIGANNGSITLSVEEATGTVHYSWAGFSDTTFQLQNLYPGSYTYTVSDDNYTITKTVKVTEDQVDCDDRVHIYSGITPNGDGNNDIWQIDGITNFPSSVVSIFNRWGSLVWKAENYNNDDVVWRGTNQKGEVLPDATYFYIIEAGGKIYKGWVELTH